SAAGAVRGQVDELPRLPPGRRGARSGDDRHPHLRRLRATQPDPRPRRRAHAHAAQLAAAGERVADAVAHVARVIRADDVRDALAAGCWRMSYATLLTGAGADIPEICRIPEALRVDVARA